MSAGILVLELGLTRLLSVTTWYHFAFFAISLALLGLGASGVFVYVTPGIHRRERLPQLLVIYGVLFSILSLVLMGLFLLTPLGGAANAESLGLLLGAYAVGAAPFFVGGAFLTLAITHLQDDVNRVYGADLVGAAAGCLLLIPAINTFGGAGAPLTAAGLGGLGALLAGTQRRGRMRRRVLLLLAIVAGLLALQATNPFIDVRYAKGDPLPTPLFSAWNSYSRVAVYPDDHDPWGLSGLVEVERPASLRMNIDASASTPILLTDSLQDVDYLRYDVSALGYWLLPPEGHALVIGPGGGRDLWMARLFGAGRITGVEINSIIVDEVMEAQFREASGSIYLQPGVSVHVDDGRNFIASSAEHYDLIQASLVDTWAASTAGAYALSENNLYTVEAFVTYIEHLEPGGVLTISRWRPDALRLVSLARGAADELGWPGITDRLFVATSTEFPDNPYPGLVTVILKESALSPAEVQVLTEQSNQLGFEILYAPGAATTVPAGSSGYIALATAEDPSTIYDASETDISPVTDDRPFFFQTAKVDGVGDLIASAFGSRREPGGVEVLTRLLFVSTLLIVAFVLLPLRFGGQGREQRVSDYLPSLGYFGCLGVGFMLMEIGLIQRFVLFLGHPVYALTVVLFTFLLGAGIGSAMSRYFDDTRRLAAFALPAVVTAGLLYAATLPGLLESMLGLDLPIRILVSVALLFPLGFLMGIPLPVGVRMLSQQGSRVVAWAWGINGAASVLGSTMAVLVAITWGFTTLTVAASVVYAVAFVLIRQLSRRIAKPAEALADSMALG